VRLLLDTCAILWSVSEPESLSAVARDALLRPDAVVHVSPISCAEIACLAERGRIALDRHWKTWFNHFAAENGWQSVDIDLAIVQEAYSLPGTFHADPADRILTATARRRDLALCTGP
jgi:PIN domain nuclease of toxin-antitoxin system